MDKNMTLVLAFAAGVVGGMLSHYLTPTIALAQSQNVAPKEVRAQSFVLVDAKGVARGVFAIETNGFPTIEAMSEGGRIYRLTRQPNLRHPTPTLLPIQP